MDYHGRTAYAALLNPSAQASSSQSAVNYDLGTPVNVDHADQPMGSNECASGVAAPFPDSAEDVSMDSGVDKRSRESPDSTLKPEEKSLKTSENATPPVTKDTEEMPTADDTKSSNVTKWPKTVSEAKSLMREVHQRMPAWKADKLLEAHKTEQVDLAALGEATGILFESQEVFNEAVMYLESLRKEKDGKDDADLGTPKASDSQSSQSKDQDKNENKRSNDPKDEKTTAAPTGAASAGSSATGGSGGTSNQDSKSSSTTSGVASGHQDANASNTGSATKEKTDSVSESHKDWFSRVTMMGQEVLWPPGDSGRSPTLLTGVQPSNLKGLETLGWEDKLESADLEKHTEYLRGRRFVALPHPLEATAWENGFVPETHGLPSEELEPRMLPLLPQLSHMVSAPRQPIGTGNVLLTRFDANIRPYWLRDWQSGFGGLGV